MLRISHLTSRDTLGEDRNWPTAVVGFHAVNDRSRGIAAGGGAKLDGGKGPMAILPCKFGSNRAVSVGSNTI